MASQRILIVEDEPLVALELSETLKDAGFEVSEPVDSADRLLGAAKTYEPDLILMDIRLRSFLDGIDAVTRLRFVSGIPVVYLTAYSTPDVVRRAAGTKPAAFLVKPVEGPQLVQTVRDALAAR